MLLPVAAPDPAAQLVELGEAEPLGALDDHQRRIGHVDPDLDHRRRDQHRQLAGGEARHHRILVRPLHPPVDQPDLVLAEAQLEHARALLGRGGVALLALLDQRADPIGLAAARDVPAEAVDHLGQLLVADHARFDRRPARRHLVDPADVHLAILGQRQRARDRGRGHHQQMRRMLGLRRQQQPLRHAEAMLLVDHREPELLVGDLLLEDRVGADEDVDRAVGEAHQHAVARPALLAAGEDRDPDAEAVELAEQGRMMLAGEDLGRGEQRRLRARLRPRSASPASATRVLPDPTSPWSRRSIGTACAMSPRISPITRRWAPVSW